MVKILEFIHFYSLMFIVCSKDLLHIDTPEPGGLYRHSVILNAAPTATHLPPGLSLSVFFSLFFCWAADVWTICGSAWPIYEPLYI